MISTTASSLANAAAHRAKVTWRATYSILPNRERFFWQLLMARPSAPKCALSCALSNSVSRKSPYTHRSPSSAFSYNQAYLLPFQKQFGKKPGNTLIASCSLAGKNSIQLTCRNEPGTRYINIQKDSSMKTGSPKET